MARRDLSAVDQVFERGIHVASRTLNLVGAVNQAMLRRVIAAKSLLDGEGSVVTVNLATLGGDIYAALGIYDTLRAFRGVIKVVGIGYVQSAGALLLQAADDVESGGGRYLTPNTTLMLHAGYSGANTDHPEELVRWTKEDIRIRRRFDEIIAGKMGIGYAKFKQRYHHSVYYDAQAAVDEKLADGVI